MKNHIKIIILITFLVININVNAQKTKNYELYSIEYAKFVCVASDEKSVFYIEEDMGTNKLVERELSSGKLIKTFKTKINGLNIDNAIASNEYIYFSSFKEIEGERYRFLESVYSINLKKQKLKKIYTPEEKMRQLMILNIVGNSLVLNTVSKENSTTLFLNLETGKISDLGLKERYYVLFVDPERNGMCLLQRPENEDAPDDLFFCDFSQNNKMIQLGQYQSDATYSSNPKENKYPHSIITDEQYKWFDEAYNKNRFPTSIMRAADYTELIDAYQSLDNYEYISSVYLVNKEFFIGMLPGKNKIAVYNIKTPQTVKKSNLTKEETTLLNSFIDSRISFEKTKIENPNLEKVFLAKFYSIKKITKSEYGLSTGKYLAGEFKGEFDIISSEKKLNFVINSDFKLNNEENAFIFEKCLDALYPLNAIDDEKKEHFKKENTWYFVRSESFGEKKAVSVVIDENGKIEIINRLKEIIE